MLDRIHGCGLLAIVALLLVGCAAHAAERQETSLNGPWEYVKVRELQFPPPMDGWQPMEMPGQLGGFNYERAWFRRSFAVPNAPGQRVKIHFGGVKWNSQVFVNGQKVGGNFGGYEPFEVDITDAVKPGAANELLVGAHDWTGVFADRETALDKVTGEPREVPQNKILSPIGGLTTLYGIWDDVKLVVHTPVYVSDVAIKTSVAQKVIAVDLTIANESATQARVTVRAEVEKSEEADKLPNLGEKAVEVPAGQSRTVALSAPWPTPHLWSHLDPHLYFLRTGVTSGETDVLRTRFGFREITIKGPDFYLNGKKIHLLATSWWPTQNPQTPEAIRQTMAAMQAANCMCFRTHTQPWCERWYSIADEVGLLMIPEGAVWNDDAAYRLDDQRFWDNYALQLTKMVQRDRNKPSVIMWSLENEFFGGRLAENTPYEGKLAGMGRLVKAADPTRPIFYESDGDPGGVADVIGIHYPHEYPDFVLWPNEADWLEKPSPYGWGFLHNNGQFVWKKDKPLYIGEFLWIPSSDPSWDTVWFGDETYRDYARYHVLSKAASWRDQIIGYRRHEVSGISPWTMIEGGPLADDNPLVLVHRYAYQPIAAFPREVDSRFFPGETVTRTLDVFNDSLADRELVLKWGAECAGRRAQGGEKKLTMPSGGHEILAAQLGLPEVTERTDGTYTVTIEVAGKAVFTDSHPISVFPRLGRVRCGLGIGLHDPGGTTGGLLEGARPVGDLAALPRGLEVIVIGAGALGEPKPRRPVIGQPRRDSAGLGPWVAAGGRAVVLEQSAYPQELVPVSLAPYASTMTFAQAPQHPLLRDVKPDDLKYWRGDHTVTAAEPTRPSRGACVPVVVSGSSQGIAHAPLMVVPYGNGAYLLCQLKVVSKATTEPTAGVLLRNLLDYAARYPVSRGRTALHCDMPTVAAKLTALGVQYDDVSGRLADLDLAPYDLLVYASSSADALAKVRGKLEPWVEAAGNVLLHGLAPGEYAKVRDLLDPTLQLAPYEGPALRGAGGDPLLFSFTNEDLYWLGKHEGIGWSTTPLATNIARAAFEKTLEGKQPATYSAKEFKLFGPYVSAIDDGVIFASAGTGTLPIEFPKTGEYVFGLVARGTPCQGVYPMAAIRVDGKQIGTVATRSDEWETYTTYGDVPQGKHEVVVAFINDANVPPEDRNLYVQTLLVAPSEKSDRSALLTSPPVLVRFPRGKGCYVLDEITWETEQANGQKASRFICGLLTGLGARFRSETGTTIQAASMDPQPGMPWFSKQGGMASFGASGYIETDVDIARAGKYRAEIVAGGTPAQGEYAIVEVWLDGTKLGQVQLTTGSLSSYTLDVDLPEGTHKLRLAYPNDLYLPPDEDRNLALDKVVFYDAGPG